MLRCIECVPIAFVPLEERPCYLRRGFSKMLDDLFFLVTQAMYSSNLIPSSIVRIVRIHNRAVHVKDKTFRTLENILH